MRRIFNLQNLLFLIVFIGLIALLLSQQSVLTRNIDKNKDLQDKISEAQQELKSLEEEQQMIGTDEYVERKAREILGYVKDNETVYIKSDN
ncbi:MAG: septum formation initiator family protein [Clostridia bacterium]|nr:septum formation initiator family protein [Clostridia bacterium]